MCRALVIQDMSLIGRCSLLTALPVLSCLGVQAVPLPTEVLSAHTAFPGPCRRDLAEDMAGMLRAWEGLDLSFDAVLVGYLATEGQARLAEKALQAYLRPGARLFIDPAMGDHGRMYGSVSPYAAGFFAAAAKGAYAVFPNRTEAALLLGAPYGDTPLAPSTLFKLHEKGIPAVLTGYREGGLIGALGLENGAPFRALSPKQPGQFPGTGDLFAAAVTGCATRGLSLQAACQTACDFISAAAARASGDPRHGVPFEGALHMLTAMFKE